MHWRASQSSSIEITDYQAIVCSIFNFIRSTLLTDASMLELDALICDEYKFFVEISKCIIISSGTWVVFPLESLLRIVYLCLLCSS